MDQARRLPTHTDRPVCFLGQNTRHEGQQFGTTSSFTVQRQHIPKVEFGSEHVCNDCRVL